MDLCLLPKAGHIEKGQESPIFILRQRGETFEKVVEKATNYNEQANWLARRLAKFFPANRRDYWQEIFIAQALDGDTTVYQHQRGGRRDSLTEDEINERLKILADVEATKKRLKITFDQACARLSETYNQELIWSTVSKWRKYRKRKNRPRNAS